MHEEQQPDAQSAQDAQQSDEAAEPSHPGADFEAGTEGVVASTPEQKQKSYKADRERLARESE